MPNFTNKVINRLRYERYKFLVDHHPRPVIDKIWLREYGYKPDWEHPRDINEKIQWLICYGDTSQWPLLADKYRVREYVKQKGYGQLLPELYGVWEDARDIDFDQLPDRFILKCNHDSGSYQIVKKTEGYDKEAIAAYLNSHLNQKYGYRWCEPHYNKIKPLILAQEFLPSTDSFSTALVDYRVWCFNGNPFSIWVDYYQESYQDSHKKFINEYDLNWRVRPHNVFSQNHQDGKGIVPKPTVLQEMLKAAQELSQGLPEARIDFYIVNNHIYFGEITLTSNSGRICHYTNDYLKELGKQIQLPL